MGDIKEFTTQSKNGPRTFFKLNAGAIRFQVKGEYNAAISLGKRPSIHYDILICLGQSDTNRSCIKERHMTRGFLSGPNFLSRTSFKTFILTWNSGSICLQGANRSILLSQRHSINDLAYVSFFTHDNDCEIQWKVEIPPYRPTYQLSNFKGGEPVWVEAGDQLPDGATIGGYEDEFLYIIRASHRGSLTPGKFVPSQGTGYIPWGGEEHDKSTFEVLCGYNFLWVPMSKNNIPSGAVEGGYSEQREPLYVGRAKIKGHLIPGKIQPSHKTCYVPFNGREIAKSSFEILVRANDDARMTTVPSHGARPIEQDDGDSTDEYDMVDFENDDEISD